MSQGSQQVYKHTIPTNQGDGFRVSITLRLLRDNSPDRDTNINYNYIRDKSSLVMKNQ